MYRDDYLRKKSRDNITIKIDATLKSRIAKAREKDIINISSICRNAIKEYLNSIIDEEISNGKQ